MRRPKTATSTATVSVTTIGDMDLHSLDHQLKMAIQNHQLLVSKMKSDPQNGALQKQLHDLQSQIKGLSEKQKQVVQQLRKELEIKQQHQQPKRNVQLKALLPQTSIPRSTSTTVTAGATSGSGIIKSKISVSTGHIFPNNKVTVNTSNPTAVLLTTSTTTTTTTATTATTTSVTATTTTKVTTNGNGNIHNHLCSTGATIVLRATSDANPTLVSALASPSLCIDIQPPIRVPQYPIIHLVSGHGHGHCHGQSPPLPVPSQHFPICNKNEQLDTFVTAAATTNCSIPRCVSSPPTSAAIVTLPLKSDDHSLRMSPSSSPPTRESPNEDKSTEDLQSRPPRLSDVDSTKAKFMNALGLVTHDILTDLQSRRSERKRRTTANPQFSYHNWDHPDKRSSMNYLTGCLPSGFKRPRGRPRIGSSTGSRPSSPEDFPHNGPSNGLAIKVPRNRIIADGEVCLICREKDDFLNLICEICSQPCHSTCLVDQIPVDSDMKPNSAIESPTPPSPTLTSCPSPFICPKCSSLKKKHHGWPHSLAAVHSYLTHKATKEQEKRRLVRRSAELKAERSQLEKRAKQLSEALSQYVHKRNTVMSNTKDTKESIDRIKNTVKVLQSS